VAQQTERRHGVAVVARHQLGDRAAHGVAHHDHRPAAQLAHHGGRVLGAVLERERVGRAQAAAVAAVVDGEHAVARLVQGAVGAQPVEIRGEHPAVEQQDGRAVLAAVAQEELAAPPDMEDATGRHGHGRIGKRHRGDLPGGAGRRTAGVRRGHELRPAP
jgi:hypothetical protein